MNNLLENRNNYSLFKTSLMSPLFIIPTVTGDGPNNYMSKNLLYFNI